MERKLREGYSEQKKWLVHLKQNKNRSEVKPRKRRYNRKKRYNIKKLEDS